MGTYVVAILRSLGIGVILTTTVLGASPVAAMGATSAAATPGSAEVLVVLDVSGSMASPAGNGRTRLQAAREALRQLVYSLPAGSSVGLRVYGAEYAGKDRSISCRDSQLLVPIGPLHPRALLSAAATLRPTGDTPIGQSLKYAASDLARSHYVGTPHIVLISDGEDNCSPPAAPPCTVVHALQHRGFKVRIETVGVDLEEGGRATSALKCISRATDGRYYDAKDTDALSAALERISSDALGGVGKGTHVRATSRRAHATLVTPGAYRFSLHPGQSAWFRFRARSGDRPRVLATVDGLSSLVVPKADQKCPAWQVSLYNPYGEGGSYPPYDNVGEFDGVGVGSTGVSTTSRLDPYSKGIDFDGTWRFRIALAAETISTCSKSLPRAHEFPVRFSVQLHAPGSAARDASRLDTRSSPSASTAPRASASPGADAADLKAKYDDPADPHAEPAWLPAARAITITLCLLGIGILVVRIRRKRQRGW